MNRSTTSNLLRPLSQIGATLLIVAGPMLGLIYNGHGSWIAPFIAATIVSILSAAGAMLVIGFALRDPRLAPIAAMGATLVRSTISLAGGIVAIVQFGVAAPPTLLMILAYYLALLIAECAILYRSLNSVREL